MITRLRGRDCVITIGAGEVEADDAGALLFSDYAILAAGSTVRLSSALAWAGAVWRLGHAALKLLSRPPVTAEEALQWGLCDEIGEGAPWLHNRSAAALDAAAMLIARRGGDALERTEFARLFATGTPQEGLAAFLEKRQPRFQSKG